MRRWTAGFFVVLLIAAFGAGEAQAAPALQVRGLSCRNEWVDLKNTSSQPVRLEGFRLFEVTGSTDSTTRTRPLARRGSPGCGRTAGPVAPT
jgi:hypothetical protein